MAKHKDPEKMDLEEVNAELDKLDAERLAVRERGRELMRRRAALIAADNAAAHGLTAEQYAEAKADHAKRLEKEPDRPFHATLGEYRRNAVRGVQSVKAATAHVGTKAK
jgi:hypothetical protein